jgi:nitrite reductase/ring-hydroxylating ferredoxin subunit/DMSO/TMAO reductase YedYZ heme-binding membrane subunit
MSHAYRAVGWNRQKRVYDLTLVAVVVLYLGVFLGTGAMLRPNATIETLLIRALGTAALLLLHVILSIGPLCRLDRRFLPLLYNRRHLGVTAFILASGHGVFSIIQFHALGSVNPLLSVLTSNGRWGDLAQFPFQPLGAVALVILFLMAATSHDFWLTNLTPPFWKALHMLVYAAYGLLVLHVALGVLQAERHPLAAGLLAMGCGWILTIHLLAGWRERAGDRESGGAPNGGFVEACRVEDISEKRARVICLAGERVAIFRYDGRVSAVSNVCQHQNGPLGEGRIIDGCITCPWHGFQYEPANGSSPPPFTEKVPTFRVRLEGGRVFVDPRPLPPGTPVEPALIRSVEETES